MKDQHTRVSLAWRGIVSAIVGGSVMISSGLVAHADEVVNNLDMSIDAATTPAARTGRPSCAS